MPKGLGFFRCLSNLLNWPKTTNEIGRCVFLGHWCCEGYKSSSVFVQIRAAVSILEISERVGRNGWLTRRTHFGHLAEKAEASSGVHPQISH